MGVARSTGKSNNFTYSLVGPFEKQMLKLKHSYFLLILYHLQVMVYDLLKNGGGYSKKASRTLISCFAGALFV